MKIFYALSLILFASLFSVSAAEFKSETNYELKESDTLDDELWISATTIDVNGTVNDDLFFLGDAVTLGGTFSDDIWGMARRSITFSGTASDDVKIYAQKSVKIDGQIEEDLMVFAHTVQLTTNSSVKGTSIINARVVLISGKHEGELRIDGPENISIDAEIDGDVVLKGKDISIEPGTHITGNLTYNAPRELTLKPGVILDGELIHSKDVDPGFAQNIRSLVFLAQMLIFSATFVFGLFFIRFLPVTTLLAGEIIRSRRHPAMLLGSGIVLGLSLITILALVTVVGIPMAVLLGAAIILLVTTGKIVLGLTIGQAILKQPTLGISPIQQTFSLFLGLLITTLASMLPLVGGFVWFVLTFVGVGAMVMTIYENQPRKRGDDNSKETPPSLTTEKSI